MEVDGNGIPECRVEAPPQLRRRSEADWRELLLRWAGTGEAVATFCRREQANICQFYAWRRRLQIGAVQARRASVAADRQSGGFVEAVVVETRRQPWAARVGGPAEGSGGFLDVVLSNGRYIRIVGEFDERLLGKLVRSLEGI